jgi:phosphatidylserine/phosphatidylglycerophosphate/cardiolipin synthase-like enzyme
MKKLLSGAILFCLVLSAPSGWAAGALASTVELAFSPDRGATELIVKTIREARQSTWVAAYSFASKPIAQALLEARKRGIDVRVVVDKSNTTAGIRLRRS